MLTNQACRLWTNSNALWAKGYKVNIFPHTTLNDSITSQRASHIWKAIHMGSKCLFKGMRCIVADGIRIKVLEDN